MELTLNLTHACNLGCTYCNAGAKFARSMTFETGQRAIALALDEDTSGQLDVAFFGGEPLLQYDLLCQLADEVRSQADARGVRSRLSVTTNGTLLTAERADALAERGFHLALSVDGVAAAQDATRPFAGGRSSAASLDAALDLAVARFTKLTAISVIDPTNVRYLAEGVKMLTAKGVRRITLNPNWLADWREPALDSWAQAYLANSETWRASMRDGRPFVLNTIDPKIWRRLLEEPGAGRGCGYGRTELAVAPSGRIYPCGRQVGEDPDDPDAPHRQHCLGDVEGGIDETTRCDLPTAGTLPDECLACSYRSRCAHSCGCSNVEATGDPHTPGGVLCWHEKLSIRLADEAASELYTERDPTFMARFYFESPTPGANHGSSASPGGHPRRGRRRLPVAQRAR